MVIPRKAMASIVIRCTVWCILRGRPPERPLAPAEDPFRHEVPNLLRNSFPGVPPGTGSPDNRPEPACCRLPGQRA